MNPDEISMGYYRVSGNSTFVFPEVKKGEKGPVRVSYSISFGGNQVKVDENKKNIPGPKSFAINMQTEVTYSLLKQDGVTEEQVSHALIRELIAQIHPVLMDRARGLVSDMGFRGLRPTLGYDQYTTNGGNT